MSDIRHAGGKFCFWASSKRRARRVSHKASPWGFVSSFILPDANLLFGAPLDRGVFLAASGSFLNRIDFSPFKNGLRLLVFCITLFALIYNARYLWHHRPKLVAGQQDTDVLLILFCILILIFAYTGSYSLFFVLTRYALPIAPLYLMGIAFCAQKTLLRASRSYE